MSEITPGPWRVNGEEDVWIGDRICIWVGDEDDARLISSAPELLSGLEEAINALSDGLWDYGPGQDEHDKCNEVIERCRAVLKKAKGQQ